MIKVLKVILIIMTSLAVVVAMFAYRNLHYDYINENFMNKTGEKLALWKNRWF